MCKCAQEKIYVEKKKDQCVRAVKQRQDEKEENTRKENRITIST